MSIVVYSNLINPLLLKSCKSQQVFRSDAGDRAWPSMEGGPVFKLALKRSRALACCGSTGMVFGARMKAVHTCGPTNSRCPARLGSHLRSGLRMAGWTRTWTWAPAISISILAPVGRWRMPTLKPHGQADPRDAFGFLRASTGRYPLVFFPDKDC